MQGEGEAAALDLLVERWQTGSLIETGFSLLLGPWDLMIFVATRLFQVEGSGPTLEVDAAGWWGCR